MSDSLSDVDDAYASSVSSVASCADDGEDGMEYTLVREMDTSVSSVVSSSTPNKQQSIRSYFSKK